MKQKIFMLLAAVLLSSASMFAQSNEPLKGDVNEDGVVDVADVVAVIDIIAKSQNDSETTYYWYVGETDPSTMSSIGTTVQSSTTAGWHEIGTSLSGFNLVFNNQNMIEFENQTQFYVVIPNDLHIYAADGNTNVEESYFNSVTCNLANYKAYQRKNAVYEVKGLVIK